MKTPEEIKKGLGLCSKAHRNVCGKCPYNCDSARCIRYMAKDALAYIQQLEDHIGDLTQDGAPLDQHQGEGAGTLYKYTGVHPQQRSIPPVRECFRVCVGDADSYYFPVLADYKDITHWMEIPEPPKEENENVT